MSDTKRTGPSPVKGAKRKPRAKAPVESASVSDVSVETGGAESAVRVEPTVAMTSAVAVTPDAIESDNQVVALLNSPLETAAVVKSEPEVSEGPESELGNRRLPVTPIAKAPAVPVPSRYRTGDEYLSQLHFDKGSRQFIATIAEFPELRVTGPSKESVLKDLEARLDTHLQAAKRKNETLPEAYGARRYPDKIEVRPSQTLSRKLEQLSRNEKVAVDQLIIEILTASVERRQEPQKSHQQQQQRQPSGNNHNNNNNNPNRRQDHPNSRRAGSRGYNDTLNNRENFMEYVRNLEKGGGTYRKK